MNIFPSLLGNRPRTAFQNVSMISPIERPYPDKILFFFTLKRIHSLLERMDGNSISVIVPYVSSKTIIVLRKKEGDLHGCHKSAMGSNLRTFHAVDKLTCQHMVSRLPSSVHVLLLQHSCDYGRSSFHNDYVLGTMLPGRGRRHGTQYVQTSAVLLDDAGTVMDAVPVIGLGSLILALGLVKVMAYSQLEVVRTAMLSRHVKQGNAKVLQLGGTTRDLYYYPTGTVKITVNENGGINKGLYQQAGMTVGIPVEATSLGITECLSKTPSRSVDSVVSFEQFGGIKSPLELSTIVSEIGRVLKPGGTFIFYQRLADGGFAQLGSRAAGSSLDIGDIISSYTEEDSLWDFCEYDVAARGLDAHAVGVAIRRIDSDTSTASDTFSVDDSAFEEILKKQKRQSKKRKKS